MGVQPVYGARYPLANIKLLADIVYNPVVDSIFVLVLIYLFLLSFFIYPPPIGYVPEYIGLLSYAVCTLCFYTMLNIVFLFPC